MLDSAGIELLILLGAMAFSWYAGYSVFQRGSTVSHILKASYGGSLKVFRQAGQTLILATTAYQGLLSAQLLDGLFSALPAGSYPLINSLTAAAGMCGFFIGALEIGGGRAPMSSKLGFWMCLLLQCLISAGGLLLSSTTTLLAAVSVGLFWSRGRLPVKFILLTLSLLYFLNLGKHEMRRRHSDPDSGDIVTQGLAELPEVYAEWTDISMNSLPWSAERKRNGNDSDTPQTLTERINNLSNLLYVMDAVEARKTPTLDGATYTLIPALLIPRILWPEKPRAHEGQVLLNTHFGRQDLESSSRTYIAWGLLPEAYGNFGSKFGSCRRSICQRPVIPGFIDKRRRCQTS